MAQQGMNEVGSIHELNMPEQGISGTYSNQSI
jgi:hypothetical protein